MIVAQEDNDVGRKEERRRKRAEKKAAEELARQKALFDLLKQELGE